MNAALAENTHKKYRRGILSFESFCLKTKESLAWPPSADIISEYIAYMSLQHYSYSTISGNVAAISYKCKISNLKDNTKQFVVKSLLEGLRRTRKTLDSRHPITLETLATLIKALSHVCRSQYETMLFSAAFALAHVALLRISEFAVTNRHNSKSVLSKDSVTLTGNIIRIYFNSSKTDQRGLGTHIDISIDRQNKFCYDYLAAYMSHRQLQSGPLFCHFDGSPLTSYQFNAVFKKTLSFTGLKCCHFKSHSFRIGGATSLFTRGRQVEEIKRSGRWRSNAYKSYIRS